MGDMFVICLEGCHGSGKSKLCEEFESAGYTILDEGFMNMPDTPLHPQTLTMETIWISRWFERLLALKSGIKKGDSKVLIADRSPYSAVFYSKNSGHLLEPLIEQQLREIEEKVGIKVITIHLEVEKELLWTRIKERLKAEPHRKHYNEDSREWMETTLSFYMSPERRWNMRVPNNEGTLEDLMNKVTESLLSQHPDYRGCFTPPSIRRAATPSTALSPNIF